MLAGPAASGAMHDGEALLDRELEALLQDGDKATATRALDRRLLNKARGSHFPSGRAIPTVPVKAGDKISTTVNYSATTKKFTLTITNVTTGKTFSKVGTQTGTQRASAEFIVEAPCCAGTNPYPLPKFGTALLGKDSTSVANTNYATDSTHSGAFNTFGGANVFKITMVNGTTSAPEAVPSAPSSDGSSFHVQWVSP